MSILKTFEILEKNKEINPNDIILSVKRNDQWEGFTAEQFIEYRNNFSLGLLALGFKKEDKILTISNNRPEWNFIDMGMSQIGVVHVPVYPNMGKLEYDYILDHSDAKMVISGTEEHYKIVEESIKQNSNINMVYTIDKVSNVDCWEDIVALGKSKSDELLAEFKKRKGEVELDDLTSIIYTSGTTGRSKGVMLSHRNIMANVDATNEFMPVEPGDKYLSFLPLCHILERMVNYLVLYNGCSVYYAESIQTAGDDMRDIKPDGFTSVPRVLEKTYDKILAKGKDLSGIKKMLFFWAIELGVKYNLPKESSMWYKIQHKIADKLIYSKWREALGGNIKIIISGGAALQERLARSFNAAGIPVMEGYGMTETSPVISVNHEYNDGIRFGTVGPILNNVEIKIEEDGEICMKGPSQMLGYYKDEEKTKEVVDADGWLHTGDIGEVDSDNFLKITDRKKEIFKLSTGKYVAPQILENRAKESQFIEQILVVGEGEKFTAAIISPAYEFLHSWAAVKKIHFRDNVDLIKDEKVVARIQLEVDKINENLGHERQIRKWALTCREWTPETGELSPTLKLKRKFLKNVYTKKLDFIYGYSEETGNLGLREEMNNKETK
ncbi:MAG: long-chain fatty acid--CoA ligase [Bacteroidales bacterium]|nr:long-chain fatty acid--CoA ligase [Bacteroidales bacterium]